MASRGQSLTLTYVAWDTDNNAGKTGDVANHTLRWVKDGVSNAPAASPAEVDATNAPGVYSVVLSAAECTCNVGTLCGKSDTANVSIMPLTVAFEQLPTVAAGAENGLPKCDASGAIATDAASRTASKAEGFATPANVTAAHATTDALITGISNVTRLSASLPVYLNRPSAGTKAVKVDFALKDSDGNMEDPDDNQLAITVTNSGGTSRDSLLYKEYALTNALDAGSGTFAAYKALERTATGLYVCYLAVASDATEEELSVKVGWEEGEAALYELRASQICDEANDLGVLLSRLTAARAAYLDALNGHVAQSGDGYAIVNSGTYGNAALKTLVDGMNDYDGSDTSGTTTLLARLTAARAGALTDWIDGGRLDLLLDLVKTVTDALTPAAAAKLALSAGTIVTGAATATTLSTTQMSTDLAEATNNHYQYRLVIWTSGVLKNQVAIISAYTGSSKTLTFSAVTEAPSTGDTFIVV